MHHFYIFILSLLVSNSFSQKNFEPGYIIYNSGDTIIGQIDYRNWDLNPKKIRVIEQKAGKVKTFSPSEIQEFGIGNEIYIAAMVNKEISPRLTNKLNRDTSLKLVLDTVFLQCLYKGQKSLYFFKDHLGRENFYIQNDDNIELLIYKKYFVNRGGLKLIDEKKKYINQLMKYFNDCRINLNMDIQRTTYDKRSLSNLFKAYFKCSENHYYFRKEIEKVKMEMGPLIGVSLSTLRFLSDGHDYLVHADFNYSMNTSLGFFFDIIFSRNHGKWSINNELLFSRYNVNGQHQEFHNEDYYINTTTIFSYSYFKINNLVRFKYPIGKSHLYLNAGISNGLGFWEKNYKKKVTKLYTSEVTKEGLALEDTRNYEQGLILGAGLKLNRYLVELRYEEGNGMSPYIILDSRARRLYLLFGYMFN